MNHNRELELYTEIISTIRQFPSYYDSLLNGNAGNGFRNACDWICNYGVTHSFRVHFSRKREKKSVTRSNDRRNVRDAHRFEKCDNLRSRLSWSRLSWKWARNKIVFQVIIHSHALERSAIILSRERPRSSSIREVTDSISFFFFFYLLVPLFPSRHRRDVEPRFIIFNSTSKNIAWKNRSSLNRKNARVESFFLLAANLSFRLFLTRYLFSYRWKNRSCR